MKKSGFAGLRAVSVTMCDCCKKEYGLDLKDIFERQEFVSFSFIGGYGSVFGDGDRMEIDLCQHCLKQRLGDVIRIIPEYSLRDADHDKQNIFKIASHYARDDNPVFVERISGNANPQHLAIYYQLMCEKWFGYRMLSNLGIVALLVHFDGFACFDSNPGRNFTLVDMHRDRHNDSGYASMVNNTPPEKGMLHDFMSANLER